MINDKVINVSFEACISKEGKAPITFSVGYKGMEKKISATQILEIVDLEKLIKFVNKVD